MKTAVTLETIQTELLDVKTLLRHLALSSRQMVTEHPHIVRVPGVCGGRPIVAGTRISVRTIVERTRLGDSPDQIVMDYPPLTLAQVYDALSYYHEHRAEIDAEIATNEETLKWVTMRGAG